MKKARTIVDSLIRSIEYEVEWEPRRLDITPVDETWYIGKTSIVNIPDSVREFEVGVKQIETDPANVWRLDGLAYTGKGIRKAEPLGAGRAAAIVQATLDKWGLTCFIVPCDNPDYDYYYRVEEI